MVLLEVELAQDDAVSQLEVALLVGLGIVEGHAVEGSTDIVVSSFDAGLLFLGDGCTVHLEDFRLDNLDLHVSTPRFYSQLWELDKISKG